MAKISEIQIEHIKNDNTFGVYAMDQHGICHDQELFRYPDDSPKGRALAKKKALAQFDAWVKQHNCHSYSDL